MSFALILHDYSNGFTHWALWNIPAATTMLPANLPTGAMPATPAGASQVAFNPYEGYAGPGAFDHVYEFRLYALSVAEFTPQNVDQGAIRNELENDPDGIVLGTSDLRGVTPPNCGARRRSRTACSSVGPECGLGLSAIPALPLSVLGANNGRNLQWFTRHYRR